MRLTSRNNLELDDSSLWFYWWRHPNKIDNYLLRLDCDCTPTPSNVFRDRLRMIRSDAPLMVQLVPEFQQCNWWISIHWLLLHAYSDMVLMWCHDWSIALAVLLPINAMLLHSSAPFYCRTLQILESHSPIHRQFVDTLWLPLLVVLSLAHLPFDQYLSLLSVWKSTR